MRRWRRRRRTIKPPQQDLIARVAQRYFDVLAAQDDLDAHAATWNP